MLNKTQLFNNLNKMIYSKETLRLTGPYITNEQLEKNDKRFV